MTIVDLRLPPVVCAMANDVEPSGARQPSN
jgi:hypothetical protein